MSKKLIIAILLLNSVIAFAQIKKITTNSTQSNTQNARIVNPGECFSGYGYIDKDNDGYGTGPLVCLDNVESELYPYVSITGDCDDFNPNVTISKYWYLDADSDGFGGTQTSTKLCYPPNASYKDIGGDCNDSNALINPNTIWYVDADQDGYGNPSLTYIGCSPPIQNSYYTLNSGDCNDSNVSINPATIWYQDLDNDGFGNPNVSLTQCTQPSGYVTNNSDCNDTNVTLTTATIYYADSDGDSYGDPNSSILACSLPLGYVTNNLDACPSVAGPIQGCIVPNSSTNFGNRNYIITSTPKVPVSSIQNITQSSDVLVNITYYDELGKPNQRIANQQSDTGKDIITHIEYDNLNRQSREYLPYSSNTSTMAFDTNALANTLNYPEYLGQSPFSEKLFESSPLNRVLKQAAPGTINDWAMGSGHEIKFDYLTNVSTDGVKLYTALATWNPTNEIFDIAFAQSGATNYPDNQLIKTITKDENWVSGKNNTTEEFKDKEGKVILKRTYDNSVAHDTYYVYDQYNNLTYVLPPLVTDISSQLDGLCYQYKYDVRNRLVEKKLPGKQWEYIVYDKLDRVVASGPALSPFNTDASSGWIVTKYDVFNRPILTAWQPHVFSSTSRKTLQTSYNSATVLNETKATTDSTINSVSFRYTNIALPTTGYHILTLNYYDDYDYSFITTAPIPATVEGQVVYYNNTIKPKGLNTGTWVRMLGDGFTSPINAEQIVTFYSEKASPIRTKKTNYLGGYTQTDTNFQFLTGRVNYTITNHKRDNTTSSSQITIKEEFTYTNQDRLKKHTHQINNGSKQLISYITYDELGKILSKKVGGTNISATTALQNVNYKYNIRGWLTEINNIANLSQGADPQDLFAFKINYNQIQNQGGYTGIPLFNGNISETYWVTASDNKIRKYGYKYDNLNRLKDAIYMQSNTSVIGNYNESLTYDKNGNIITLNRTGLNENTLATSIDNLSYSYEPYSNKLSKVTDATNNASGFKDGTNTGNDFSYDTNGNMISDLNKGISSITYNHLNLPKIITFSNGNKISYIYNAIGEKLNKKISNSTNDVFYLDGFQYTNSSLDYFSHAEGYVATGNVYVFQYKDHLGNVRLSYKANTNGTALATDIIEENHYYPFGLKHSGYNATTIAGFAAGSKYKYNGKELQDELGVNWLDYGWRNYDPAISRWVNMDPLLNDLDFAFDDSKVDEDDDEEVYEALITKLETGGGIYNVDNLNSYVYGYNNPVSFDDPDGRCIPCLIVVGVFLLTPEPVMAPTHDRRDGQKMADAKNAKATILLTTAGAGAASNLISKTNNKIDAKANKNEKTTEKPPKRTSSQDNKPSKVEKSKTTEKVGDNFTKKTEVRPSKERPGQSRAEYVSVKNKDGKTVRTYKDSYDRANKFKGRKPLRGGPEGRPQ